MARVRARIDCLVTRQDRHPRTTDLRGGECARRIDPVARVDADDNERNSRGRPSYPVPANAPAVMDSAGPQISLHV